MQSDAYERMPSCKCETLEEGVDWMSVFCFCLFFQADSKILKKVREWGIKKGFLFTACCQVCWVSRGYHDSWLYISENINSLWFNFKKEKKKKKNPTQIL